MNSLLDRFIEDLENTYGKYRSGMAHAIRQKLYGLSEEAFDNLASKISSEYDMARPPSLKVILSIMRESHISGASPKHYTISVCEHCGKEFSINSYRCPHCKQLRKYGIAKLIKDKPFWHEAEQAQMKKDELEIEDEKRRLHAE